MTWSGRRLPSSVLSRAILFLPFIIPYLLLHSFLIILAVFKPFKSVLRRKWQRSNKGPHVDISCVGFESQCGKRLIRIG